MLKRTPNCELTQLVVDSLLHALQDHRYSAGACMEESRCGTRIAAYYASKESDVFSFGVVALEISCGRKAIDSNIQERKKSLVEWVWDLYGTGTLLEAADPRLNLDFSEEEIKRLMIVGLWCAHLDSNLCPSMKQAIQVLNSDAPLPVLPSEMPKVTYSTPAPTSSSYGGISSSSGSSKLF
ncbi:putative non-specific serine/threonine protein kinase [Helianthus anomalus]